jgi:putative hydroxymethylpyrimidine transport system substrate-binding protein
VVVVVGFATPTHFRRNKELRQMNRPKRPLRFTALLLVAILLASLVAACGDDDEDEATATAATGTDAPATVSASPTAASEASPTTSGSTGEKTHISLALDWYPWSNHTGIFMALENGYFAEEGLEVEVNVPADPTTALQLVATGKDDFTISYQADVLYARSQGLEVQSVAALVQHPLNTIMALESSGITEPADLEGTTIGVTGVPSDEAMLGAILEDAGLSLDDVEVVNVGFDLIPSLLGGSVDAIIGGYYVHETILAEQQGKPVVAMNVQDYGVPDYYELLLVTGDAFADENPDAAERFIRALQRGYEAAAADPDAAVDALMAAYPETAEEVEREGIGLIIPLWTDDGAVAWGTQTEERWQSYHDWLRETGLLEEDVDVNKAFTNKFVERANAQ